jgi:hypothetical protein
MTPKAARRCLFGVVSLGLGMAGALACGEVLPEGNATGGVDGATDASVMDSPIGADGAPTCAEVNLESDPKNCGACGRDCLGGICSSGKCQPFVIATTTDSQVPWLTVDATHVLWLTSKPFLEDPPGALYACPKLGACGASATLLKPSFKGAALVSDGTTAYFSDTQFGDLAKVVGGGVQLVTAVPKKINIFWMQPRDGAVFVNAYYEDDAATLSRAIYRAELSGAGGFQHIATFTADGTKNADNTVFTKTHVYLGTHDVPLVAAAPLAAGGGFSEVLSTNDAYVGSMTTDGDRVYFVRGGGGPIFSCQGDGAACSLKTELPANHARFAGSPKVILAADGLLFVETTEGDIVSCVPNDCPNTLAPIAREPLLATDWHFSGHNIAIDANAVYYVARESSDASPPFVIKRVAREKR